jgi:hypothetical protein
MRVLWKIFVNVDAKNIVSSNIVQLVIHNYVMRNMLKYHLECVVQLTIVN